MKKVIKMIGKILLGFAAAIVLFLLVVMVWNWIAVLGEKDIVRDTPGQMVEVDGHDMSIYTEGEGDHTVVFMSGWGTPSPIYDFRPLYSKLSGEFRIVVIEKFGYGFSDVVDGERDFDTILRQDREALAKAGIEAPYILCPHSLSGLEAVLWAQKYPDEVEAIIGLDMSLPDSYELEKSSSMQLFLNRAVKFLGINRFLMSISEYDGMTGDEVKKYTALVCGKSINKTVCRELGAEAAAWDEIKSAPLPAAPTIQYISGINADDEPWISAHQAFADASADGQIIQLGCGHYVHQFESERIAKEMKEFLRKNL